MLLPDRDRGHEAARLAAAGAHLLVDPEADAAGPAVVRGGVVSVIEAVEVPEVVAAVATAVEEAVEAAAALRQRLCSRRAAALEASQAARRAAAAPVAVAR